MQVIPYLAFDGNCREAFEFYERCLGGRIEAVYTYGETPAAGDVSAASRDKIINICLALGDRRIMGCDATDGRYERPRGFSVNLTLDDPERAERIFRELSDGGQVVMPFEETFWALRFGMAIDRFGTPWMINCDRPG